LRLDGRVVKKRLLTEKHPGNDDVFLIELRGEGTLQVDRAVFEAIGAGNSIRKEPWARQLQHNGDQIELTWSKDLSGMVRAMPMILGGMLAAAIYVQCASRRADRQHDHSC